jgi:hypothetical protein
MIGPEQGWFRPGGIVLASGVLFFILGIIHSITCTPRGLMRET